MEEAFGWHEEAGYDNGGNPSMTKKTALPLLVSTSRQEDPAAAAAAGPL
jgi:hypothetical protein